MVYTFPLESAEVVFYLLDYSSDPSVIEHRNDSEDAFVKVAALDIEHPQLADGEKVIHLIGDYIEIVARVQ